MTYTLKNTLIRTIKKRQLLSNPSQEEKTYHIVLDTQKAQISYQPGDSLVIYVQNDPVEVKNILKKLSLTGQEIMQDKKTKQQMTIYDTFLKKVNLFQLSPPCIKYLCAQQKDKKKKQQLTKLIEQCSLSPSYLRQYSLFDLLDKYCESSISYEELTYLLLPLIPRFYSIASSALKYPDEIHILVKEVCYVINKKKRYGIASRFLCQLAKENVTPLSFYVHPSHNFSLPSQSNQNIIMIGAGTGVSPYRSFLQERLAKNDQGKNWLIFGEKTHQYDFYYKKYFLALERQKKLLLDLAFSRDQKEKIYVQHKMLDKQTQLFQWLEKGAYIYLCGDAKQMAKEAENALLSIVKKQGKMSEQKALDYIKKLKKEKRYFKDVY